MFAAGFGLSLAACVDAPDLSSSDGMTFDEFRAATPREPWDGGYYIVGGDEPVRDDAELYDLWSAMQSGALSVKQVNNVDVKWTTGEKLQLAYCVSDNFGAQKAAVVEALRGASDEGWELLADVNFTHVASADANCAPGAGGVLFDVQLVESNGTFDARAFFPDYAPADRHILIDNAALSPTYPWPLRNVLAHELGHVLGLRHEHIRPEAGGTCTESPGFRPLTAYDSASVMHYPQCNGTGTDLSFTELDRVGISALYGPPQLDPPMAQINQPLDGATVMPDFDVLAQVVDSDLDRVELAIDGAVVDTAVAAPFEFPVVGLAPGTHVIELTAYDDRGHTTERRITVTVGAPMPPPGDGDDDDDDDDDAPYVVGGCSAGGGAGGLVLALAALAAVSRRRRR